MPRILATAIVALLLLAAGASPATAADARYRIALDGRIGPAVQGDPSDLVRVFGEPSSRRPGRHGSCELRWMRHGLRAFYSVLGDGERSACQDGQFVGAHLTGKRWWTTRGLRVGVRASTVRRTGARRCSGTRCFSITADRPFRNGWILSTHPNPCAGMRTPTVIARTTRDRVSSFQVNWIGCE